MYSGPYSIHSRSLHGGYSSKCTENAKQPSPTEKSSRTTLHYNTQNDSAPDPLFYSIIPTCTLFLYFYCSVIPTCTSCYILLMFFITGLCHCFSSRCMPELRFVITQQQTSVLTGSIYGPLTQVLATLAVLAKGLPTQASVQTPSQPFSG